MKRTGARGITLVEMMVAVALLAAAFMALSKFFNTALGGTARESLKVQSQDELRRAMDQIERDFMEMNQIELAGANEIQLVLDYSRHPSYNPNGNDDPLDDTVPNRADPDRDGDMIVLPASPNQQRFVGNNLQDDDENGNGRVDVICRYARVNNNIVREMYYDRSLPLIAATPDAQTVIARNVSFVLSYWGSKNESLGKHIDLGNDGRPAGDTTGEGDGIISPAEIDMTDVANGGNGNVNGALDTDVERGYIVIVGVALGQDRNNDGQSDFTLSTELAPPLLSLRDKF